MSNATGILSVSPSQKWDGADGRWSTFEVGIGTPPQSVRLLPGTSATAADSIWVIISEGCEVLNTNLTDCANKRGNLFRQNASTSYSQQKLSNGGLFSLALFEEDQLGLTDDNAYYGFDTVQLPTSNSTLTLPGQTIASIATNDFFLGTLGLSPHSLNITDFNTPIPSLLGNLRNQSIINSTSWAYTAGKPYASPSVYGSLTFGGYDTARGSQSSIDVPFYQDISRDLVVGLQSITYDSYGSTPLLTDGIYTFMDSLITEMWMPQKVCDAFQTAFNLSWSPALQLYYVTDDVHKSLVAQQPTFSFTLGSKTSGGNTTQISFPYAAFDLNKTVPDISATLGTSRYFPIKRAANSSQYTLGRVFFQEAYVVANYDTQMFSVRQALNSSSAQLVSTAPTVVSTATASQATSLTAGAIAGIVVAVVAFITLLLTAIWLVVSRRRKQRQSKEPKEDDAGSNEKAELAGVGPQELEPHDRKVHELKSAHPELHSNSQVELSANKERAELAGGARHAELSSEPHYAELSGAHMPTELDAPRQRWELPGE